MDTVQLKRIPLFSDASDDELKAVAPFANSREVAEGTELIAEQGFSNELMAIEEGTVEVRRGGEKLADLGPGDIFGETGMIEDAQRNASVIATSRVKLITLGTFELKRLRKRAPAVYQRIVDLAEKRAG